MLAISNLKPQPINIDSFEGWGMTDAEDTLLGMKVGPNEGLMVEVLED